MFVYSISSNNTPTVKLLTQHTICGLFAVVSKVLDTNNFSQNKYHQPYYFIILYVLIAEHISTVTTESGHTMYRKQLARAEGLRVI